MSSRPARSRTTVALPMALATLALALSGCAGAKSDAAAPTTAPTSTSDSSLKDTTNRTLKDSDSPWMIFLASTGGEESSESEKDSRARDEAEYQKKLAQCMKDQGFDYFPVTNTPAYDPAMDEIDPRYDDLDVIKTEGFGLATQAHTSRSEPEPAEEGTIEVNFDYVLSLSDSEREAYDTAMNGVYSGMTEEEAAAAGPYDWRQAGCTGSVSAEVYPQYADKEKRAYPTDEYQDLISEGMAVAEAADQSAEMKALNAKWQDCMGQAGYAYTDDNDAYWQLYEEFDSLGRPDPNEQNNMLWDTSTPEFTAFQEKEIAVALAAYDCREKLHFSDEKLKIRFALEEKFIADHRAELDAYKDAAELGHLQDAEREKEFAAKKSADAPQG